MKYASSLVLGLALGCVACAPAGAMLTTARTLPRGKVDAGGFIDVAFGRVGKVDSKSEGSGRAGETSAGAFGALVRVGVARRVELGARVGVGVVEVSSMFQLVDGEKWAMAIAPRVQSSIAPPFFFRAPLLASLDLASWTSLTPRVGLGYGVGSYREGNDGIYFANQPHEQVRLSSLFAEFGLGWMIRATPMFAIALEGYVMKSIAGDPLVVPGAAIGLLGGPQPVHVP